MGKNPVYGHVWKQGRFYEKQKQSKQRNKHNLETEVLYQVVIIWLVELKTL